MELGQYTEAQRAFTRANTLDPGKYQGDLDEVAEKLAASQAKGPPAQPTVPPAGQQQAAPNTAPPAGANPGPGGVGGGGTNTSASPLAGLEALFSNPALAGMVLSSSAHDPCHFCLPGCASEMLRH